jgi:hypothetical protein
MDTTWARAAVGGVGGQAEVGGLDRGGEGVVVGPVVVGGDGCDGMSTFSGADRPARATQAHLVAPLLDAPAPRAPTHARLTAGASWPDRRRGCGLPPTVPG